MNSPAIDSSNMPAQPVTTAPGQYYVKSDNVQIASLLPQQFEKSNTLKMAEKIAIGVIVTFAILGAVAAAVTTVLIIAPFPPGAPVVLLSLYIVFLSVMGGCAGATIGSLALVPVEIREKYEMQKFAEFGQSNFEIL